MDRLVTRTLANLIPTPLSAKERSLEMGIWGKCTMVPSGKFVDNTMSSIPKETTEQRQFVVYAPYDTACSLWRVSIAL